MCKAFVNCSQGTSSSTWGPPDYHRLTGDKRVALHLLAALLSPFTDDDDDFSTTNNLRCWSRVVSTAVYRKIQVVDHLRPGYSVGMSSLSFSLYCIRGRLAAELNWHYAWSLERAGGGKKESSSLSLFLSLVVVIIAAVAVIFINMSSACGERERLCCRLPPPETDVVLFLL